VGGAPAAAGAPGGGEPIRTVAVGDRIAAAVKH